MGLAPFLAALKLEYQEAVPMDRLEMGATLGDILGTALKRAEKAEKEETD